MFLENKYTKWYYEIIDRVKKEDRKKGMGVYYEEHHIIPSSIGGSDDKENKVMLTGREHYVCHSLLMRMCSNKHHMIKMAFAFSAMNMINTSQDRCRSKQYNYNKELLSECISAHYKEKFARQDHHNKGLRSWAKDLVWVNKDDVIKRVAPNDVDNYISEGWSLGHGRSSEYQKQIASKTHKSKKVSNETRQKQSESHKGKTNATKNKKYINCDGKVKRVNEDELEKFLSQGWHLGRGSHSWSTKKEVNND